ncbi:nuclease domain-containing protein 1, partial [Striga asiatica]
MVLADMYTKPGIPWKYAPERLKRYKRLISLAIGVAFPVIKEIVTCLQSLNIVVEPLGYLAFVEVLGLTDDYDQVAAIQLSKPLLSAPKEFRVGLGFFHFAGSEALFEGEPCSRPTAILDGSIALSGRHSTLVLDREKRQLITTIGSTPHTGHMFWSNSKAKSSEPGEI